MPELPDIVAYVMAVRERVEGRTIERIRVANPFLLRSVSPPLSVFEGATVADVRRMGKRLVFGVSHDRWLVLHLMIAGRLRWEKPGVPMRKKLGLAAFDFAHGTLMITEAGTKRRAWLRAVEGGDALRALDPGGLEPLEATAEAFAAALTRENHTLKRTLTDPRLFSGIGNAYSDEILHRARLSPFRHTRQLEPAETERLFEATTAVLSEWMDRLCAEAATAFPAKVTAFRPEMAVHGKFGQPCPSCATPVQRIVYAENECNYCPECQTGGRLLADRALSRLLRQDWPRNLDEMEQHLAERRA
jgi:formamidopyrimidine-DNA glycosylase